MKEYILKLFFCLFSFQLAGQSFNSVEIEKKDIDSNNKIYKPGLQFVFDLKIILDNDTFFLKLNNDRTFEFLEKKTEKTVSRIFLTVAQPNNRNRTNKRQTEIFYSYQNNDFLASSTGLVENEKNVWIHPPRDGFFSILQLFPFPFTKFEKGLTYRWTDKLLIDEKWSNELIGTWSGKLKTELEYEITDIDALIETSFGEIKTKTIESKSKSKIGVNSLKASFSDEFGFVILEFNSDKNVTIRLELIEVNETKIFTSMEQFLMQEK